VTTSTGTGPRSPRPVAVTWSWQHALVGVVYALPSAVVTLGDPAKGLPLALGVLPAVIIPVPARRSARIAILLIGLLVAVSLFLGGVLAHLPSWATAAALVAVVLGAALLASIARFGLLVLSLCAPLVGAGLSYTDFGASAQASLLLATGAVYAWLVSLAWPQGVARVRPERPLPPRRAILGYGLRMGVAAAIGYLIASGLSLDHPGWAPAACLLVARPRVDLLQTRGVGRVLSVIVGAGAAGLLLRADLGNAAYAVITVAVLAAAAATVGSRWYITSAFTTFFVFLLLLNGHPGETVGKFNERVGETVLGVALAYLFGWALPAALERSRGTRSGAHAGGMP
jgi:hypothetical protein